MKKIIVAIFAFIFLIIAVIAVTPFLFKDKIVQFVKDTANENLNAQVDFGEFDLSLLSTFPNFLFEIEQVEVIGKDTFALDTLVHIDRLAFKVNLESVFNGNYEVESFELDGLKANAIVLENGVANWDVVQSDSSVVEEPAESGEAGEPLKFALSSYRITNTSIHYDDRQGKMSAVIKNLNHEGKFSMEGDLMLVDTKTLIDALTYEMEGVAYANKVRTEAKATLELDLANSKYVFKENEFKLNELKLALDGWVAMPGEDIEMDLKLGALNNTFGEVLSLIPAVYKADLAGIETQGDFDLQLSAKGTLTESMYPTFNVLLSVKDGFFKYPELPESVNNIQVELKVDNQTGNLDQTVVNLNLFHLEVAKNPIDFKFYTTNIETNPILRGEVKSKFNLEYLTKAIPMEEGVTYKGRVNADVKFNGDQAMLDREAYDEFDAQGQITLIDLLYESKDLPAVFVKNMYLNFTPSKVELGNLDLKLGKSDLNAKGTIDNLMAYVFTDDTLSGRFTLNSNYFNLDEWMAEDSTAIAAAETTPSDTAASAGAVEIPMNIDFVLAANFKKIDYDNMPIENLKGKLTVRNSAVAFEETSFNILGGKIGLDGVYDAKVPSSARTRMNLTIDDLDVPVAFQTFNTVEKMAPIAKEAKGKFSTSLKFDSQLDENMDPVYPSINGGGDLLVKDLMIENNDLFNKVADALKNDKYRKMRAENLKIKYQFNDGKLFVKPFDLKLGTSSAKVSGWTSFEQQMEYLFEFKIPRSEFGGEANAVLDNLAAQASKYGAKVDLGEFVFVDVVAKGPIDDPKISIRPKGMGGEGKSLQDQATDRLKDEAAKLKKKAEEEAARLQKEAEERARAEAEKLQKEAEAKAKAEAERIQKEAEAKAKAEADRVAKEAEAKAKKEAEKQAKDLLKGFGR